MAKKRERKPKVVGFDWSKIKDDGHRNDLTQRAHAIRNAHGDLCRQAIENGRQLKEIHAIISCYKSGYFGKFVEFECGISRETANKLINVYCQWGENIVNRVDNISTIEITALYALSTPKVPRLAYNEARRLIEDGRPLTAKTARAILKKHKPQPKPKKPKTTSASEEIIKAADEEPTEEELRELTPEERMEADNHEIESFANRLLKYFNENVPDVPWLKDAGRINSARGSIKSACGTLRQGKAILCPACGGRQNGKPCKHCKEHGFLPKALAKQVEGVLAR